MNGQVVPARQLVTAALKRYWPKGQELIEKLPIPVTSCPLVEPLPPVLRRIRFPDWAGDIAPGAGFPIPSYLLVTGEGPEWARVDWWQVACWYLFAKAERSYEEHHGPIHSYSWRLLGWDSIIWERAWVNRIALFLRRWVARNYGADESELFGVLPIPEIHLTHDVDAISKTMPIRLKQSAFNAFNAIRRLAQGQPAGALSKFRKSCELLFSSSKYWYFDDIAEMEQRHGLRSVFNLYGGGGGLLRHPRRLLFDPAYDVAAPELSEKMRDLIQKGWRVGVHQSFDAWSDEDVMREEKLRVEHAVGQPVTICRQHWLRFSWLKTWQAQSRAGFKLDTTLGFNDRPGFRCGAALCYSPLSGDNFQVMPMVLMDSHLYDYLDLEESERCHHMRYWIDEIRATHGQATVLWHTHVLSRDYGWLPGFEFLLTLLSDERY